MNKPPVTLFYPSYVVEYALVDSTVAYQDTNTLNVDGEWLGSVPKLAICRNIETSEWYLAHCNSDWEVLSAVETAETVDEIKQVAERHYKGIGNKWTSTGYTEEEARNIFEEEKQNLKCSFCGRSPYDKGVTGMVAGENATICNICVASFSLEVEDRDS